MARKLYIFTPSGRVKVDSQQKVSMKWLGGYTSSYAYLGDVYARKLGVGDRLINRNALAWPKGQPVDTKPRAGASRHDPSFRGWG